MQISKVYLFIGLTVRMFSAQETELLPKFTLTVHPHDTVWEGDSVTLTCLYETNNPKEKELTYKWYRELTPLSEGILQNQYKINSAQQSHTGNYWCEVTIKKSSTKKKKSDKMKVTVKERTSTLDVKPEHSDRRIFEGDEVTLHCLADGNPVGWTYKLYKGTYGNAIKRQMANTFTFSPVTLSDSSWYCCQAENRMFYTKPGNRISLHVSELFTKPTLTVTPKVIWEGDTVTLKCQSVGFLGVQLLYEFYKVSSLGQNSRKDTYTIQSAQQSHMGKYWCEAEAEGKRIMKKNSDNVPVTVKECPKATVKVKNEKIPVYVGDTVTMECLIENSFEGWKYRWYKKNQPFMEHQIEWYTHQTYTILSVTQSDSGEYWCNASRNDSPRYAQSRSPLTLTIQECPKATVKVKNEKIPVYVGDTVTLECLIENSFEGWKYRCFDLLFPVECPKATVKVKNEKIPVYVGDTVTLECLIENSFEGWKYRWYKKNQPFMEHQIEGYTQRTYTIQSVTQSDSGQYWCNASRNDSPRYAQSRSPLSLTIQAMHITLKSSPGWSVKVGDSLNLTCTWTGNQSSDPTLHFSFLKDNVTVKNRSASAVYNIKQCDKSHAGTYMCVAESPGGGKMYSTEMEIEVWGSPLTAALVSIGLVLFLLVLLLLLFVYHKTRGLPCTWSKNIRTKQKESDVSTPGEGGIKMDSLNKEEENSSMVYSELVYLPDDKKKGNSTAESSTEVVYSDLVIEKLKKKKPGKKPAKTLENVYADVMLNYATDDTAAKFNNAVFSNAVQEKVQKKKKYGPPAVDPSALYASVLPRKHKK
ncbi:Fc receptor-like protein 5 [Polypterus senegalus]|uniref:Fc receptor-like protein 5 n=1 Tax=Polypterus senegalus TaxID=55291 RepID=UPI0019663ACA|nr:Fc receptor-like protein 5 [Polypterus senegalus]